MRKVERDTQRGGAGAWGENSERQAFHEAVRQWAMSSSDLVPFRGRSSILFVSGLTCSSKSAWCLPAPSLGPGWQHHVAPPWMHYPGLPQWSSFATFLPRRSALKTSRRSSPLAWRTTTQEGPRPCAESLTSLGSLLPDCLQKRHKGLFPGLLVGVPAVELLLPELPLRYCSFLPVSESLSHPLKRTKKQKPTLPTPSYAN